MALTTDRFWNLLGESRLLKPEELGKLAEAASKADDASGPTPDKIVKWLVAKSKLSQYQAKILLAGHAGPFFYGDYQIYDRIESGRLAGTFRAIHVTTRHPVCLFFLAGAAMQDEQMLAELTRQAAQANRASLGHPHLFRCYHLADEGTYKFVVIEDLQGRRIERMLATSGAMAAGEACRIARQAALGLARLHAMGLVHGEIRPANIWLDKLDQTKLLLFPLVRDPMTLPRAWLANLHAGVSESGGKLPAEADYIAPELIRGDRQPDARSDIYSLGCTLYHMLANQPPFPRGTLKQKLRHHLKESPRPLTELNPQIPAALGKFVGYMMAKDPDLRYQKAESVVEGLLPHLPSEAAQTQPQPASRSSQAYEAWLLQHAPALVNVSAMPQSTPVAVAALPVSAVPIPAQTPAPTAEPMLASAMPVMTAPVMAAPVMAAPMMGSPMMATPLMATPLSSTPVPPMMATPMMATPMYATAIEPPQYQAAQYASPAAERTSFDSSGPSLGARSRSAKRRNQVLLTGLGGLLALILVVFAGLYFGGAMNLASSASSPTTAKPQPTNVSKPAATTKPTDVGESQENTMSADDDATTTAAVKSEPITGLDAGIWASPTSGKPLELKYLALGMQAIVALRPADLLKLPEGKHLLAPDMAPPLEKLVGQHPLGALGHWVQHTLPGLCGTTLDKIEQVVVGWPESGGESGNIALVARLAEPADEAALMQAWGSPEPMTAGGEKFFIRDNIGYYLPKAENGRVVVIAPADEIKEVIDGSALLLAPDVEKLLQSSDATRSFTMVMPTRFLSSGGKAAFEGAGSKLQSPIDWLLTGQGDPNGSVAEPPKAILLSADLTPDTFFAEVRLFNSEAGPQVTKPAETLRDRVHQIPKSLQLYMVDVFMTDYSKKVLFDFVDKIKALIRETRYGTGDKQVVVRSYLPASAALHLALGTHLCLLENVRGGAIVGQSGKPAGGQPKTIADKLKKVTSLSFPRNTLEVSMQMLAEDLSCPIVIIGTDLQLDGITKNQSFELNEKDKPAVDIFKTIFAKANTDGKLVYVIKPDSSGTDTLFITTRAAVAKRGDKLPPEFAK